MHRRVEISTPADVFFDPVVQLAALCPICALAALRPEAAIAALAPGLVLFNPAVNPAAALLSFALAPVRPRRWWARGGRADAARVQAAHAERTDAARVRQVHGGILTDVAVAGGAVGHGAGRGDGGIVVRPAGAVVRPGGNRWVFSTLQRT